MNIPHRYFVVADIEIEGEYIGSFLKTRHFFMSGAFRSMKKKRQQNYESSTMMITHSLMDRFTWNERLSCVNPKFFCGACDKHGPCADDPRLRKSF